MIIIITGDIQYLAHQSISTLIMHEVNTYICVAIAVVNGFIVSRRSSTNKRQ